MSETTSNKSFASKLRIQSNQHPLDADLEIFNEAAKRIEDLEQKINQAVSMLSDKESAWLLHEWSSEDLESRQKPQFLRLD